MYQAAGAIAAILVIAYIGIAGGLVDLFLGEVPAPVQLPILSSPIPCDFTAGPRCYVSSSTRARLGEEAQ